MSNNARGDVDQRALVDSVTSTQDTMDLLVQTSTIHDSSSTPMPPYSERVMTQPN